MLFKAQTGKYIAERRGYPRKFLKLRARYQCLQQHRHHGYEGVAQDIGAGGLAMGSDLLLGMGELLMLTLFLPPEGKRLPQEAIFHPVAPGMPGLQAGLPAGGRSLAGGLNEAGHENLHAAILSRVAWCVPAEEKDYILGVQFLDMDRENRKRLKAFLVDYSLDQPDSRLYI